MSKDDLNHMDYIATVSNRDVLNLQLKESTYRGSWKKRGGVGAFMMLARKWDRIENMLNEGKFKWDIFTRIESDSDRGSDGTMIAEIRDLRRYLILVEAEMMAQGVVESQKGYDVKEDSNKHAFQADEPVHPKVGLGGKFYSRDNGGSRSDRSGD
jgi:hypothetical protein